VSLERHNGAMGFDIGLVNAATGATVFVPGAVNTAADEFHPALTPDGRFLVFTRATLVGQPDGDVVPPATRELLMLDRQTGQVRNPSAGAPRAARKRTHSPSRW
jgi:Tol biopolymer transport system component